MANVKRTSSSTRYDTVTRKPNRFAQSFSETVSREDENKADEKEINALPKENITDTETETVPKEEKLPAQIGAESEKTDNDSEPAEKMSSKAEKKSSRKENDKKTKNETNPDKHSDDTKSLIEKLMDEHSANKRGAQKSIYFEADNYEFIETLANSAGVGLSKAVNEIISYARKHLEQ